MSNPKYKRILLFIVPSLLLYFSLITSLLHFERAIPGASITHLGTETIALILSSVRTYDQFDEASILMINTIWVNSSFEVRITIGRSILR